MTKTIRRPEGLEDDVPLPGLDLLPAEGGRVLQLRNLPELEGNVVREPGHIQVQTLPDPLDVSLSDSEERNLHRVQKYQRKDSNVAQYLQ